MGCENSKSGDEKIVPKVGAIILEDCKKYRTNEKPRYINGASIKSIIQRNITLSFFTLPFVLSYSTVHYYGLY